MGRQRTITLTASPAMFAIILPFLFQPVLRVFTRVQHFVNERLEECTSQTWGVPVILNSSTIGNISHITYVEQYNYLGTQN